MKMRSENTAGVAQLYRRRGRVRPVPPPNSIFSQGRTSYHRSRSLLEPPKDNKPVQQGSKATFQVDVKNTGWPDIPGTDYSVRGVQVWDVLPTGIDCNAITNFRWIDPDDPDEDIVRLPVEVEWTCAAGIIKWKFPSPDAKNLFSINVGDTLSVLYDMAIPNPSSVSTNYKNTSYVRKFDAFTDILDTVATYYPRDNIDPSVPEKDWDSPPLSDPSNVYVEDVTLDKSGFTSVDLTGNNRPADPVTTRPQATIGETITYTYTATVPARSTVYNGVLSDELPTGIVLTNVNGAKRDGVPLTSTRPQGPTTSASIPRVPCCSHRTTGTRPTSPRYSPSRWRLRSHAML